MRFRGALLGLAVGDALGTTVEFQPPGSFKPVTDITGGGPFGLLPGAWTDDTSMALCLAESLIECRGFDPVDQLQRYVRWYREGYWSSTGRCFDIGNATRGALRRFENTGEPFPGDADRHAAGNGPLMKLAPIPMAFCRNIDRAIDFAGQSARTTHGAPEAVDATRYFSLLLVAALTDQPIAPVSDLHPQIEAITAGSFRVKAPPEIRGGGYVVEALEAALWAINSTHTYKDAVIAAVNLGDDADTTAAIAGQLAGSMYGVEAIPGEWLDRLVMREEITAFADQLLVLSAELA